ncbi:MAG: PEP-CTERM sorting domain-containing protein [Armatimonadetes bacterium]|nr:PEP-CTERM sorting domain-containing protein [Armatimonadota bacterium]
MNPTRLGVAGAFLSGSAIASCAIYNYATWTDTPDATHVNGTVMGIGLHFAGVYMDAQLNNTGTYYWTQGSPPPYTSAQVSNGPATRDVIRLRAVSSLNRIEFDSPVGNPIMDVLSLGRNGGPVRYTFNQPFTILSEGQGYFGNGTLTNPSGNILEGREGHGTIMFSGNVSSIEWTVDVAEFWHGFTIGAVPPVPEPSSLLGLCLGVAVAGRLRLTR